MAWDEVFDRQEPLPTLIRRQAQLVPKKILVRTDSDESATWLELRDRMDEWAGRFGSLDVRQGEVVVTLLDAGLTALSVWLGLSSIGAVDASTNCEFRGRMLAYAINNCRPSLLVVDAKYLGLVQDVASALDTVRRILVVGNEEARPVAGSEMPSVVRAGEIAVDVAKAQARQLDPQPKDIACITYTSGTTGPSKAVMLPWGQLHCINLGTFPFEDLSERDVLYCTTSHAHFGSKSIPYLAAMIGGEVVIRSKFSLTSFWSDVRRFNVTTAMLVGSMADSLLRSADSSPRGQCTLKNLFMAPLSPRYRDFCDQYETRVCTVYNSTEGGVAIRSGWNPENVRTCGKLRSGYPGFEVRLVDENEREVPDGTPGECVIRAGVPWVMNAGYFNNPEATSSAWRQGWFHTGDALLKTPDGEYLFVDRLKDVIRRRGENISSFEVEADVLMHPEILECAAVAVPGEFNDVEILLFAVKKSTSTLSPADLGSELERRMPRFTVPRYIEFVEGLPKTQATQRVMKSELRTRGLGPNSWDRRAQGYVGGHATTARADKR